MVGDKVVYLMFENVVRRQRDYEPRTEIAENQEAGKDLMGFAGKLVTMMTAEVVSGTEAATTSRRLASSAARLKRPLVVAVFV